MYLLILRYFTIAFYNGLQFRNPWFRGINLIIVSKTNEASYE